MAHKQLTGEQRYHIFGLYRAGYLQKDIAKKIENFVTEKLLFDWNPEQISGYAKRHDLFSISHERIYQLF